MEIRTVKEDPRYSVSCFGEIFGRKGKLLNPTPTDRGYLRFDNGKREIRVHRAVAEAFIPNPLNLPEINHKDGNKDNNRVDNLEWATHDDNMRHAYKNGLIVNKTGEAHPRAILTKKQVDEIRKTHVRCDDNFGQVALGKRYGVTNSCIWRIVHGDNWGG
jgi:hypothetical protein